MIRNNLALFAHTVWTAEASRNTETGIKASRIWEIWLGMRCLAAAADGCHTWPKGSMREVSHQSPRSQFPNRRFCRTKNRPIPMFRLLGTLPKDKRHDLFNPGHVPPRNDVIKDHRLVRPLPGTGEISALNRRLRSVPDTEPAGANQRVREKVPVSMGPSHTQVV